MKRVPTTILLFAICLVYTAAQYSDFDLSSYRLPDIKTHRLDIYPNIRTNTYLQNLPASSPDERLKPVSNSIWGNLNASYSLFSNSSSVQRTVTGYMSVSPQFYKLSQTSNDYSRSGNFPAEFSLILSQKFYVNEKYFIGTDPSMNINLLKSDRMEVEDGTTDFSESVKERSLRVSLPVSAGIGRIEPVQDARLAIYILEDLYRAGKIQNPPSEDFVLELAREISAIKKKRILDSRLRKIEELMVIDAFLRKSGIVTENDIEYAALLNDNWDYSSGPERLSGFNVSLGIVNRFETSLRVTDMTILPVYPPPGTTYRTHYNRYSYGLSARVAYHKPIDLHWQFSSFAEANLVSSKPFGEDDAAVDLGLKGTREAVTAINLSLSWLPNSRTTIKGFLYGKFNTSGSRYSPEEPIVFEYITRNKSKAFWFSHGFLADYYFSPRLTGTVNLSAEYFRSRSETSTNLDPEGSGNYIGNMNGSIHIGIVYSLF